MDNQSYYNGDFWQCVTDTNAGESPDTAPAKWRRIQIPREWRRVLAKLTFANLLELDGQTDKANLHRSAGESMLEDLVREAAMQENDRRSGSVRLPQGAVIAASVILDDAYGLMRWDSTDLEDSEIADGRRSLSAALQQVWEAWWWDTLMVLEQLTLRDAYVDATLNAQGAQVYFPADRKYYQAVQMCVNIPPASIVNGQATPNNGFWAEMRDRFCGPDLDNTQAYPWGAQVRNPVDGLFYQRCASYQTTGAGESGFNTNWTVINPPKDGGDYPLWGATNACTIQGYPGKEWAFATYDGNQGYVENDGPAPLYPDQVTSWQAYGFNLLPPPAMPAPTLTRLFVAPAPPDNGHWGLLAEFDHVLTIATTVRSVSRENPMQFPHTLRYRIEPTVGGVRVPDWHDGTAWVWSRRSTPVITGNNFDATAQYAATPTEELVYDS